MLHQLPRRGHQILCGTGTWRLFASKSGSRNRRQQQQWAMPKAHLLPSSQNLPHRKFGQAELLAQHLD